jgi:hypothetical protein
VVLEGAGRGSRGLASAMVGLALAGGAVGLLDAGTALSTVTPCRVLDTRTGSPLAANQPRQIAVTGACGIPSYAVSVVANVTVVGPSAPGALVVYPAGTSVPATSALNFAAGATRANNAQVSLSPGGSANFLLAAQNGALGHLLVDVVGFFGTSPFPFAIGGATVRQHNNLAAPDTGTLTSSPVATTTGSLFLCSIARGIWANAPFPCSDNQGNAYSIVGTTHAYAGFPGAQSAVYQKVNGTGSPTHTFSVAWGVGGGGRGGGGDEVTVSAVEVKGATSVTATTFVERTSAATISGLPTSTSGPGVLVSFCWGNGPVGITHDFRPGAGWTRMDAATATGDPSRNGYIQVAVAYRIVSGPTTDTVTWSNVNAKEGGQIYTLALQ